MLLVYGFLFMALIAACIAVSLGELASAYPNSGLSDHLNDSQLKVANIIGLLAWRRRSTRDFCHIVPVI